jgi:DNA-binding response OmpR family regulator
VAAANGHLVLCVEDELYRDYLEQEFATAGTPCAAVAPADLAQTIAENPTGVLLLQSESAEQSTIELSARLKRLFGQEIRVLLLSADYQTEEAAGASVDAFLQYPASFEEVRAALAALRDTSRRVLLIDDSRLVHNHLVPPLREQGYQVFQAFDGAEGLERAKECRPHLIICDIEMPKMNGFEVCAAVRSTEGIADCYLIMSSTLGSASDQQKGFQAGVDEYIQKPVVLPELLDRIKKALNRARGGREHVLIVEDDEQVAKAVAKSLTKQGFSTRTAATLKEVRRLLKRAGCDLVVSEMTLADGSMLDLMGLLRTLPPERQPDVLILTSRDSQADARMVLNAGAAGVISKPFTMDSLLAAVERTLADRRASQEKAQLQKYVSKASLRMALEKSVLGGTAAAARAYRKRATVFFSDIAGFTTRCETYPPREVVAQVNALFEVMTRIIMAHQGDIDKFIGDACMAFWMDDDPAASARRALRATLAMRPQIAALNAAHPTLAADPIRIRVGINTGEVILCDLGAAEARMDLTVIGDTVNVAARFESASKQYGTHLLVGESTYQPVESQFVGRLIDLVRVKGKNRPVGCYEVLAERGRATPQEEQLVAAFARGMEAYRAGDFGRALEAFQAAEELEADNASSVLNPSRLYQERCRQLRESPPADWDGVWTLASK